MSKLHNPKDWFGDHANLVTLTAWMAENHYDVSEVARAVEKPWNYEVEYLAAVLDIDDFDLGLLRQEYEDDVETEYEDVIDDLRARKRNQELDDAILNHQILGTNPS